MFTYSHANTPLGQSERAYYLSYFIKEISSGFAQVILVCLERFRKSVSQWSTTILAQIKAQLKAYLNAMRQPFF